MSYWSMRAKLRTATLVEGNVYETDRTRYVGNHVKVGGLISGMPNPAGVAIQGMERQTTARPYGVTIYYGAEDAAGGAAAVEAGRETFRRNAVLLLSLIDNVDWIAYSPADDAERQDDEANVYIWTREQVNQWFREDDRNLVADEAGLRQLIDRVDRRLLPHD